MDDAVVESSAAVATDRPGRYARQLVAHLSRRSRGEWDEESGTGWIEFETARADLHTGDAVLHLRVRTTAEQLDRFEAVVGEHLVRFGTRDELVVQWIRADGQPGTGQRRTEDDETG